MEIAAAYACSHAGIITTRRDKVSPETEASVFSAFEQIRREIEELAPDAIVMLATDHMQVFPLPMVATFAIGVGPVAQGLGDGGLAPCRVPVHQPLSRAVLAGAMGADVDMVFSEDVRIDHSFVMPLTYITPGLDRPIVPVTQNCNVPPRPSFARSRRLGEVVRSAIEGAGPGRVVVVATGGLSHWVGSEERQEFMKRPAGTRYEHLAEFPFTLEETGPVNATWDRLFLDHVQDGSLAGFAETWTPEKVEAEAGNGAQEIRNWLTGAAIVRDAPAEVLAYEAAEEWMTGTAVVRWDLQGA
jgi:hypothetical protein